MSITIPRIRVEDFEYALPAELIAQQPAEVRDASRLLWLDGDQIREDRFFNLAQHLPRATMLVFNDTKVIRARILFRKPSGTKIEVFCLEPVAPTQEISSIFQAGSGVEWNVLVGNLKKWKSETLVINGEFNGLTFSFYARLIKREADGSALVRFEWDPPETGFGVMLEWVGKIPLPPYIQREAVTDDTERYQTIYARHEGSVAAPTAGLHFTPQVIQQLNEKNILREKITLHVGAGTFRQVTSEQITDHVMHQEKIRVSVDTIKSLIENEKGGIVAVGTTAARTLESLYWSGYHTLTKQGHALHSIPQWIPYEPSSGQEISMKSALLGLLESLEKQNLKIYEAETRLMIVPGYRFRVLSGLITNFHIPGSTLLMLVAALIGDQWRSVYQYALENRFRFLSYGDSCLFFKPELKLSDGEK